MFTHGANIAQKERKNRKYSDAISIKYLQEIREYYDQWHSDNMSLLGPRVKATSSDQEIVETRVRLLNDYKDFIDQQHYAEHFDSRSNLHSSVIEEFLFYLFKDLVADFGQCALIGKSRAFKDLFFVPPNYRAMVSKPFPRIEVKDHDFTIGVQISASMKCVQNESEYNATPTNNELGTDPVIETYQFELPAIAIECKTYLDKTMLEASSTAASQLKDRNPNSIYLVLMEWIKLTQDVNLQKYHAIDQIYVMRKQKNTDREFRFDPEYEKNPIFSDVIWHMYDFVRRHLTSDWKGGVEYGMTRGWLLD